MTFKAELDTYRFIMDIETYVLESTSIPFTNKVIIDKDIMYDFLDRLRTKLPQEMRECKNFIDKKHNEEIVSTKTEPVVEKVNTQIEESKILNSFKAQADTGIHNEKIMKEAEEKAQEMILSVKERAEKTSREAEAVALQTIKTAEEKAQKIAKDAEERAQIVIKEAYEHAEGIVKDLEFSLGKQIADIKDGRGQIANITKKLRSY